MARLLVWMLAGCLLALGCGKKESAREPAPPVTVREQTPPAEEPPVATPAPTDVATNTAEPTPAPETPASQPSGEPKTDTATETAQPPAEGPGDRAPESTPVTEAPSSPPSEATAVPNVVDPGGTIEVAATKPGLTRIGVDKCKVCHKIQFESWATTAHAKRTPPLDCEGCHGPGSEYKPIAIMKDPAKAAAAGLVKSERSFCEKCHVRGWSDDLMARAHAHKPGN